jgi:hypothetical protein
LAGKLNPVMQLPVKTINKHRAADKSVRLIIVVRIIPYHSKESTQGDTAAQVWPPHHNHGVVDYKALIGLSLLRVPHFHARPGASLKDLNIDTTSTSKAKYFIIS